MRWDGLGGSSIHHRAFWVAGLMELSVSSTVVDGRTFRCALKIVKKPGEELGIFAYEKLLAIRRMVERLAHILNEGHSMLTF